MKKTIQYSARSKTPPLNRFSGVVLALILIFGLFSGFLPKTAFSYSYDSTTNFSSTNYLENVHLFKSQDYITTHKVFFTFHVKTTFQLDDPNEFDICLYDTGSGRCGGIIDCFDNGTYSAGQTYSCEFSINPNYTTYAFAGGFQDYFGGVPHWLYFGTPLFWTGWVGLEENPFPFLTISFPHDNDELAGAFYIDGEYSTTLENFNFLFLNSQIVGYSGAYNMALIELTTPTGTIHQRVGAGFPANNYILSFQFSGAGGTYNVPFTIPIKILVDIPPELPTGETTPTIPQYGGIPPDIYYTAHSVYATSTGLYNDLKDAVGGVIQNIGDNLAQFSNKFSLTDAQTSGLNLANSILTMRAYLGGVNSFFGSLPVAQFLVLYLIAFLGVVIFRLIKGLINLIKI